MCLPVSADIDGTGLVPFRSRQKYRQNPIAAFGLDAARVYINWQSYGSIKAAGQPFPPMQTGVFRILDRFGASQADRATLHLNVEVGLVNSWLFGNQDQIIAFAKDVERRIATASARA